jgi:hypothetical protein
MTRTRIEFPRPTTSTCPARAPPTARAVREALGTLRDGDLFEGLLYDCKGFRTHPFSIVRRCIDTHRSCRLDRRARGP